MTSTGVDLTVSIVSYHVADELRACLESALGAAPRHDIEIIVVDNASGAPLALSTTMISMSWRGAAPSADSRHARNSSAT